MLVEHLAPEPLRFSYHFAVAAVIQKDVFARAAFKELLKINHKSIYLCIHLHSIQSRQSTSFYFGPVQEINCNGIHD